MRVWCGDVAAAADVVVVGSGAIGLTAALAAADGGARVAVLEKAPYLGGTAAVSGGMLWVPLNRRMAELGIADDRDAALRYLAAVTAGRTDPDVLAALVDRGPEMLEFLERRTGLRMVPMAAFPDYHPEWDGAHPGGRSLDPELYDATQLGELAASLRPDARLPFTMREYEEWRIFTRFPEEELRARAERGLVARGRALVAPLVKACADAAVTLVTGCAAERLLVSDGAVVGVTAAGGVRFEGAEVVLACGGFEWAPDMVADFLSGPVHGSCSPPHNTGDGIRMAAKAGAGLGSMREAWWGPMVLVPGDKTDGAQTATLLRFERTGPHTVIVNRAGRRFVNEAHNYNDMTKAFHLFDPRAYDYANLPAWLVFDQRHLSEYGFLSHRTGRETPSWIRSAPTLAGLADAIGVDAPGLAATLERFNAGARAGLDPEFHRGESAYDRYWGDQHAPHPALGPVETPPFYAVQVVSGVIGTKGGVVTDGDGRALDSFGDPVPGLYAAGNTTAHPMGPGYPGAGATLGPGSTMAYAAGLAAAARLRAPA
ncbi:FAD-dependent oxidoreductase [Pseudonocardia sp. KRD-184]|uniref:FAD-dependent oxidoreductase n=1 Tax=Pseudonocardia oceani TaxID=2792013 RepID=A0ABS6UF80_9PSEU|nr:FAD-dependent oxidoreductase [Pseudonocardia oceani]MBW0090167.1 FAD-dependent oxidoreductase [Pseudonocardia oceani]MBW0097297.1 FAD-dependent oxidoreductase [Pseudonocardia oceani]MBW0109972.1 FAD-dependent oxidoreductase [Pseudonocardia oceani]MBW0120988.1 FAD-dependent oxidoreductase [Pseudonocardia oceani]MBW0130895.1 FAD-dependent oxidoreductase [Pseudonocardia oceani]